MSIAQALSLVVITILYIGMVAFAIWVSLAIVRMSRAMERISQVLEERLPRTPLT